MKHRKLHQSHAGRCISFMLCLGYIKTMFSCVKYQIIPHISINMNSFLLSCWRVSSTKQQFKCNSCSSIITVVQRTSMKIRIGISALNHYKNKNNSQIKWKTNWLTWQNSRWKTLKTVREEYLRHWNMYQSRRVLIYRIKPTSKNMKWVVLRVHNTAGPVK